MSEHTPGPWKARRQYGEGGYWLVLRGAWDIGDPYDSRVIARAPYSAMSPAENEANAHLIAAAPDMLVSLESAHERLYEQDLCLCDEPAGSICEELAVIRKAKGEAVPA